MPNGKQVNFYSKNFLEWIEINLNDHSWLLNMRDSYSCLFGLIVWRLWKNRNLYIF